MAILPGFREDATRNCGETGKTDGFFLSAGDIANFPTIERK
jgi:hypothetical protein